MDNLDVSQPGASRNDTLEDVARHLEGYADDYDKDDMTVAARYMREAAGYVRDLKEKR